MKVCKSCGSQDVACTVWMHCNTKRVLPMGETTFYKCFNCNNDSAVIIEEVEYLEEKHKRKEERDKLIKQLLNKEHHPADYIVGGGQYKEPRVTVKPIITGKMQVVEQIIHVHKKNWIVSAREARYWVLAKNADKLANKRGSKVLWDEQQGDKVPILHFLPELPQQRRTNKFKKLKKKPDENGPK